MGSILVQFSSQLYLIQDEHNFTLTGGCQKFDCISQEKRKVNNNGQP